MTRVFLFLVCYAPWLVRRLPAAWRKRQVSRLLEETRHL